MTFVSILILFLFLCSIWEFYSVCVEELILSTVIGVISVTGVALLFIPHWSAAVFVFPLICMLYLDLLGLLQWAGTFHELVCLELWNISKEILTTLL